jgi:NADH dehydrogenase
VRDEVVSVFGGAGFIGRHVVARLARAGAVVRVFSRQPSLAIDLKPMGAPGQIVLERLAYDDDRQLAAALAGARHAINLIGILYERRAGDFQRVQGELPGRIGAAAAAAGVRRLVQLSAIGADPGSSSLYARSKAAGEQAVRAAFPAATILRPSIVVGPEDGFFNRFAAMAKVLPALPLIGGGLTRFQPVYVGDVADAVMAALLRPDAPGRTYELGGPRVYTFKELMAYLLHLLGRRRALVPVPWGIAMLQARFLERLPSPLLTRDQVELLRRDNVVAPDAAGLADLGVTPTPIELVVPTYIRHWAREPRRPAVM